MTTRIVRVTAKCPTCGAYSEELANGKACPAHCETCRACMNNAGKLAPSHFGSRFCYNAERGKEAGSLASGGTVAHCSCSGCF